MRRRPSIIAGTLAAALSCAVAAPAATAATQEPPPPAAQAAGLLDDVGTTLDGVLAGLQGGQAPTATLLMPVHDLLYDVAATSALPPTTQQLVRDIADLLVATPAGQPLDPALLAQLATLLRGLAATDGVPVAAAALLNDLANLLDGDGDISGLAVDALSLPPRLIERVGELLTALEDGQPATGTLLAPIADLLDQAAATPGLAAPLPEYLRALSSSIDGTAGELDPLLADQAARALRTLARTSGLTPSERIVIERTATILAQSAGTQPARAATRRDRAVVKRIRLNRARTRIAVRVACPRSAPATCVTTVRARFAGRKAAHGKRVRVAAGRSKVVRLKVVRAARTASVRSGGRLRVRAVTAFPGGKRFAHEKTVRVKPRHRH